MNVEFIRLPAWRGGLLAAEYDRVADVARINIVAVERIRERLGDAEAQEFVTHAIAHERYHRDHPQATERDARAFVHAACGNAERFEAILRA